MNELKAFDIVVTEEGYGEGIVKYRRAVYDKSEADKVIAEKDKQLRHQKFKRCLAMARWCMNEYLHSKCLDFTNTEQWYWRRWHIRWQNLAKKFKEAK